MASLVPFCTMGVWSKKLVTRGKVRRGVILFSTDSVSVLLTWVHREELAVLVMHSSLVNTGVKWLKT